MNSSENADFDNCVQSELEYLYEPADANTLYSNRFYDNQVAQTRCYNKQYNPLSKKLNFNDQGQIAEGFNSDGKSNDDNMFQKFLCFLISVVAIILAIIFACSMCKKKHRGYQINDDVVYLGIPTESRISSTYNRY